MRMTEDGGREVYLPSFKNLAYVPARMSTLMRDKFLISCIENKTNIIETQFVVSCTNLQIQEFVQTRYDNYIQVDTETIIAYDDNKYIIDFRNSGASTTITIYAQPTDTVTLRSGIESAFKYSSMIKWVYDSQYLSSIEMPLYRDDLPIDCFYPWLGNESLADYYDRFLESSANILLLIGAPGTGKTSFVRGLLAHGNQSCVVTYSDKLLSNDEFFANWISNNTEGILVIEDADHMLLPRENGNDMMHRLLNIGDGLLKIPKKKMIFTTNISDVKKIDEAMTRPGRCFDIAKFDRLTNDQAKKVASVCNLSLPSCNSSDGTYSLAEVFIDSSLRKSSHKKIFGFV